MKWYDRIIIVLTFILLIIGICNQHKEFQITDNFISSIKLINERIDVMTDKLKILDQKVENVSNN